MGGNCFNLRTELNLKRGDRGGFFFCLFFFLFSPFFHLFMKASLAGSGPGGGGGF